jgi:hypothetical protein
VLFILIPGGQSSSSDESSSHDRASTSNLRVNISTPLLNNSAQQQNDSQPYNDRNNEGFRDDDNFD